MRLPVSRARFDLLSHNYEQAHTANRVLRRANDRLRAERDEARAQAKDLLDKYHALKLDGFAVPAAAPVIPEQFGPLTRAALNDMSIGQSGIVKRKMREKATALWLEQRGQQNQDEVVAIAVRNGEGVR